MDEESNKFKRDYKHLSSDLQKKTRDAIRDLAASPDPRQLGDHKTGPLDCLHAYKLGRKYRILYDVCNEQHVVVLLRVGLHDIYC
ncbi:MAG: type II toxin-antitoxin system RelE family toxin [Nitrosotalea sp.]